MMLTRLLLCCLLLCGLLAGRAAEVGLARDSRALLPVIVSAEASPAVRAVAAELAGYLSRITGAEFAVREGDGTRGIVLGTPAQFPDPTLAKALEIRDTYDGREAYIIRTEPGRVRLIGATELGASHAAFRLLEEIGCRWFFPAKAWEVVPSVPDLRVSLNVDDRPAFVARRIWYGYGYFADKEKRPQLDTEAWQRHNRLAGSHTIQNAHAWQAIIADNKALIAEHPEYLALVNGKRQGVQLCVSNPAVRKLMIDWALAQCRKYPERDMVSMETSDNTEHCECPDCLKLGSVPDRVFGLANEAARAVAKAFPGKMVGMLAYSDHSMPPTFPLEPNVYVMLTAGFNRGDYTFDELLAQWAKQAKRLGIYLYLSYWTGDHDMPPGMNGANLPYLRTKIPAVAKAGATSMDCQAGNNWGPYGRGYYIANRLMWNPNADVDALLQDFYDKAFGPAAPAMRRYYERLDPGNHPLKSAHLLGLALRDMEEACRLAKDRPDVLARLDQLKQYLHYVRLRWDFDHESDVEKKLALGVAGMAQAYRTRFTYLNHWNAVRAWGREMAREHNKPEWLDAKTPKPWEVETPVTPEETERIFREDLAYFQPQEMLQAAFSERLVPAGLPAEHPAGLSLQLLGGGGACFALYSRQGEPLECTITAGTHGQRRNRPDAAWTLADGAGKEIAAGRLPLDGTARPLKIAVPAAGAYWLTVNDYASGWQIDVAPGRSAVYVPRAGLTPLQSGVGRLFFYVPKGARQFQYYWSGQAHDIRSPDGKVVKEVTERDTYVTCDVPAGMDGQAWSFTRFRLGTIFFQNIPNCLAASPDALLVPAEVAGKER
ncbi:MAG: DUF4838 domain-containing protein [Armatimonadota bacterium]